MPVKVRLMRIGTKKRPFYRVVAVDERKKRTGEYIELLGTYNPLTEPKEINLKQDRIDEWLKNGAQPSTGFLRIIGRNPQKPPRKPKKEPQVKKEVPAPAEAAEKVPVENEEQAAEETPEVTETQVETPTEESAPGKTPTESEQSEPEEPKV